MNGYIKRVWEKFKGDINAFLGLAWVSLLAIIFATILIKFAIWLWGLL